MVLFFFTMKDFEEHGHDMDSPLISQCHEEGSITSETLVRTPCQLLNTSDTWS